MILMFLQVARFSMANEQVFIQDYVDTTSPTMHMESVHLLLNIAAAKDWDVQQINVKTAFLYGLLPLTKPSTWNNLILLQSWVRKTGFGAYSMDYMA